MNDVAGRRLRAQGLTGEGFASAVEAVRSLGCVQSQDYGGARWALALRTRTTAAEIDRRFDEGAILRTHVLRPTWHFAAPMDIDWLLQLTGPRIRDGFMRARHRQLGLDDATVTRACSVFETTVANGRPRTRPELAAALSSAGISPEGQRLPHLITCGEIFRVIVSGPRRGKQFTWALFEERATRARSFDREEAAALLARRYFESHGPAQLDDFRWWSGLTAADARRALDAVAGDLEATDLEGKRFWSGGAGSGVMAAEPVAHLLPNFDEYLVAYRDRSAALVPGLRYDAADFSFGSILSNVVLVDGKVRGSWRRGKVGVELRMLDRLRRTESEAVERAKGEAETFLRSAV